jgi:hypothetical protein
MPEVSLPVSRPIGRALVVASPTSRSQLVQTLVRLGFDCGESDDPYTALLELCRRRLAYRAMIVSLAGLFRSELAVISTVKRRFPHVEVWLAHTDGRQADLAESMRLGADGLLGEEGFHRIATAHSPEPPAYHSMPQTLVPLPSDPEPAKEPSAAEASEVVVPGEPVLTADELRALLQDPPVMPPSASASEGES